MAHVESRISVRRAAEVIFRTGRPNSQQIERVTELIAAGELSGDSRGTSLAAVADFVSRSSIQRQRAENGQAERSRQQREHEDTHKVYQESLKDYFLAVFLRRKRHRASKRFQRAVVGGQILVVFVIAVFVLFSMRALFPPQTPERKAAISWLEENTDRYRIIKFHPTTQDDTGRKRLWVEYHYTTPQGRGIDTRRLFTIEGNHVVAVDTEE